MQLARQLHMEYFTHLLTSTIRRYKRLTGADKSGQQREFLNYRLTDQAGVRRRAALRPPDLRTLLWSESGDHQTAILTGYLGEMLAQQIAAMRFGAAKVPHLTGGIHTERMHLSRAAQRDPDLFNAQEQRWNRRHPDGTPKQYIAHRVDPAELELSLKRLMQRLNRGDGVDSQPFQRLLEAEIERLRETPPADQVEFLEVDVLCLNEQVGLVECKLSGKINNFNGEIKRHLRRALALGRPEIPVRFAVLRHPEENQEKAMRTPLTRIGQRGDGVRIDQEFWSEMLSRDVSYEQLEQTWADTLDEFAFGAEQLIDDHGLDGLSTAVDPAWQG